MLDSDLEQRITQTLFIIETFSISIFDTQSCSNITYSLLQMVSASESSLSEAETNKLIDQNMRLQKVHSAAEKELESVKQQNLEIIHQRDFYQDQVI